MNKLIEDYNKLSKKKKIFTLVVFSIFIIMVFTSGSSTKTSPTSTNTTPIDPVAIGENGFIRLPGITNTTQKVCLGATKESAEEIARAIRAKDLIGILEIPGTFCITNGTPILLIDTTMLWSRVRITGSVDKTDEDKFSRSGWLPMEWVAK